MNKQEIEQKLEKISNKYWENKDLKPNNLQNYFLQSLKESFNLALDIAAENAEIDFRYEISDEYSFHKFKTDDLIVDKESILKYKL